MIRDLSETLEALLEDPALITPFPQLAGAKVVFDRPTDTFAPTQTSVDLFLYDIRENLELRSNEPILERHGATVTIKQPPRRIDCSYLVTAWPVGGADLALQEHRLLSQTLQVLGRYPTIPAPFLKGSLVGQLPPLPMLAPQIDGLKSPADFWAAMGNKLRASFTVTATVSLDTLPDVTGPLVTTKITGYDVGAGVEEERIQIGGRVLDGGGAGVAGAVVDVPALAQRTVAGEDGRYTLLRVPRGSHTFRVAATGFQILTRVIEVPGKTEDYDLTLTPL